MVSQSQRIYRISIYFHISIAINQTLLRSLDANSLDSFQFPLILTPREDLCATRQKVLRNQSALNLESAPLIYLKSPDTTFLPNQGQHGRTPSFCRIVGVTPLAPWPTEPASKSLGKRLKRSSAGICPGPRDATPPRPIIMPPLFVGWD